MYRIEKTCKLNRKNPDALILLGDLAYGKRDYKGALKFYKEAMSYDKGSYDADVKTAKAYLELGKKQKAHEILAKVLKSTSDSYEAYYLISLLDSYKELAYLKKTIGLNSEFADGWLELADFERERANYALAQTYLNNAYNLDQTYYKYYYYQGKLFENLNDNISANYYIEKSKKLNPNFIEEKKEKKK